MTGLAGMFLRHATDDNRRRIRDAMRDGSTYTSLHCEKCRTNTPHKITPGPVWTRFTCTCGHWEDYRKDTR